MTEAPHSDPRWVAVEQVLASRTLGRAQRLSAFLSYICEKSLKGCPEELTEQQIGIQVFDRPPGYSPGEDNIVRSAARQLRQKLTQYYETEAVAPAVRIDVPKGGYVAVFQMAPAIAAAGEPAPKPFRVGVRALIGAVVLSAAFALAGAWVVASFQNRGSNHEFWRQIFSPGKETLVVVGDAGLNVFDNLARRQVMAGEYMSGRWLSQPQAATPDGYDWAPLAHRRYTTLADLNLVEQLYRLPEFLPRTTSVRFARDIRIEDLKGRNVILAGSPITNPWSELIANRLNFYIQYDGQSNTIFVRNRNPRPGEKTSYQWTEHDPGHIGYAHIALTSNPDGAGRLLLVEGTTMGGLNSATDFLMNGSRLRDALAHTGSPDATHEFLLEAQMLDGSSPSGKVISVR